MENLWVYSNNVAHVVRPCSVADGTNFYLWHPLTGGMWLVVTIMQKACGLCKWHHDCHSERGFGWKMPNLSPSHHHETITCTLKQERYE